MEDVAEDFTANQYGAFKGLLNKDEQAKDLVHKYRIPGIDEKY